MTKKERFNSEFSLVNNETGEEIIVDDLFDMLKSISQDNKKQSLLEKRKIERDLIYYNLKNDEGIYGRRFIMLYQKSLRKLNLNHQTIGVYTMLIEYIREDGSCSLYGETTKKYWMKIVGLTTKTFDKIIKELEDNKLLVFIKNRGFFLNPYYIRYGNRVNKEIFDMFDNIYIEKDIIYLKNDKEVEI